MTEQWIIRVHGKEYGPADLATLHEWKAEGRVLASNPARRVDVDLWRTAADIPGLFRIERPPVQRNVEANASPARLVAGAPVGQALRAETAADTAAATISKPPGRNVLGETFRIYFRGFFQFLALTLLTLVPSLCSQFADAMIQTAANVDVDLRTMVTAAFSVCMFVLTLVLWPVYVAGIQVLSAELSAGRRASFLSILNHAVKYWPRVAGLCIFVYIVFLFITAFGLFVLSVMLAASISGSVFWVAVALGLALLQLWFFCRFFVFTLFWQQFAVLENLPAFDALRESSALAHSASNLPWYQRPLWRGALIVSLWTAVAIAIASVAWWPRFVADWPVLRDAFNQLFVPQDPEVFAKDLAAKLSHIHGIDYRALALIIGGRILQPMLGIAFVVLYLDSKREDES